MKHLSDISPLKLVLIATVGILTAFAIMGFVLSFYQPTEELIDLDSPISRIYLVEYDKGTGLMIIKVDGYKEYLVNENGGIIELKN